MADIDKLNLVAAMLGRNLETVRAHSTGFSATHVGVGDVVLLAEGLRIGRKVRDARVEVRQRQIVGLAGLLGSGRTEVARAIFGADPPDAGTIQLGGQAVSPQEPAEAIALGVGYCSEDRKADGIVPDMSVRENMTLSILPRLTSIGIVDEARQREIVDKFMRRLAIKASSPEQKIRELSGGNQQKVLLARWLCTDPKLLILDEPTRGIDVGAKAEIQALIRELADQGLGVLMISSELEEITEGADRVFVLSDGRTVADLPHAEANADAIMAAMAHSDPDARCGSRSWLMRQRSAARALRSTSPHFFKRYAALTALIVAARVQFRGDAAFRQLADPQREPDPGRDDRHRLGRHDLVIATGGIDLSVGSLMAISGALAPMIFMSSFGRSYPVLGDMLGVYRSGGCRRALRPFQRMVHHSVPGPADRRHAGHVHRRPGHRAGADQWQSAGVQEPDVSVHRPRPHFRLALPGRHHAGAGRRRGMDAAPHLVRRHILSVGGNERAARLSGVPVAAVKRWVYAISGLCAGIAGLVVVSINSSSDANLVGLGMELDAIARSRSAARRSPAGKRPWSARSLARCSSSSCATLCSPTACPTPRRWL